MPAAIERKTPGGQERTSDKGAVNLTSQDLEDGELAQELEEGEIAEGDRSLFGPLNWDGGRMTWAQYRMNARVYGDAEFQRQLGRQEIMPLPLPSLDQQGGLVAFADEVLADVLKGWLFWEQKVNAAIRREEMRRRGESSERPHARRPPTAAGLEKGQWLRYWVRVPSHGRPEYIIESNRAIVPPLPPPKGSRPAVRYDGRSGFHDAHWLPQWIDLERPHLAYIPMLAQLPKEKQWLRAEADSWYFQWHSNAKADIAWYGIFQWMRDFDAPSSGLWKLGKDLLASLEAAYENSMLLWDKSKFLRKMQEYQRMDRPADEANQYGPSQGLTAHWERYSPFNEAFLPLQTSYRYLRSQMGTSWEIRCAFVDFQKAVLEIRGWFMYCLCMKGKIWQQPPPDTLQASESSAQNYRNYSSRGVFIDGDDGPYTSPDAAELSALSDGSRFRPTEWYADDLARMTCGHALATFVKRSWSDRLQERLEQETSAGRMERGKLVSYDCDLNLPGRRYASWVMIQERNVPRARAHEGYRGYLEDSLKPNYSSDEQERGHAANDDVLADISRVKVPNRKRHSSLPIQSERYASRSDRPMTSSQKDYSGGEDDVMEEDAGFSSEEEDGIFVFPENIEDSVLCQSSWCSDHEDAFDETADEEITSTPGVQSQCMAGDYDMGGSAEDVTTARVNIAAKRPVFVSSGVSKTMKRKIEKQKKKENGAAAAPQYYDPAPITRNKAWFSMQFRPAERAVRKMRLGTKHLQGLRPPIPKIETRIKEIHRVPVALYLAKASAANAFKAVEIWADIGPYVRASIVSDPLNLAAGLTRQEWRGVLKSIVEDCDAVPIMQKIGLAAAFDPGEMGEEGMASELNQQASSIKEFARNLPSKNGRKSIFRTFLDRLRCHNRVRSGREVGHGISSKDMGNLSHPAVKKMVWELTELDFRQELLAFDMYLHRAHPDFPAFRGHVAEARLDSVSRCWGAGDEGVGVLTENWLCSQDGSRRALALLEFARLMSSWPRAGRYLRPWDIHLRGTSTHAPVLGTAEFDELEQAVWLCYAQIFNDYRQRPPALPYERPL